MSTRKDKKGRVLRVGESQRKDGSYMYKYQDMSGKARYIYSSRLLKRDKLPDGAKVQLSLREMEDEINQNRQEGIAEFGGDLTVYELAERYLSTKTTLKENTMAGHRTTMKLLAGEAFSKKRIDKVRTSDAKLWFIKLNTKNGKGHSTLRCLRGILNQAFKMAVEDDLIKRNPFAFPLGDVVPNDCKKREAMDPEVEEEFLKFIHEDNHYCRYYEAIFILLNTGLRISEFCGLTPEDVDFEKNCIHVRGQLVRHSNMLTSYETPKTSNGYRDIPMSKKVAECFRVMEKNRKVPEFELPIDGRTGFYCLDMYGRPTLALHWEHYFQRILIKYNDSHDVALPHITPHVCRHTFCSKMARAGMNPKNLQYIMGHSEIGTTLNTYTHLGFQDAQKEFQRIFGE